MRSVWRSASSTGSSLASCSRGTNPRTRVLTNRLQDYTRPSPSTSATNTWTRRRANGSVLVARRFRRSSSLLLSQSPNLECFITRIGEHPERLQNAYFAYVVLLRALSKSGPQLLQTLAETSSGAATDGTKAKLEELIHVAHSCPSTFDETSMFSGPSSQVRRSSPLRRPHRS